MVSFCRRSSLHFELLVAFHFHGNNALCFHRWTTDLVASVEENGTLDLLGEC